MKDIFLSYASADRERASRLVETLEAAGLTVWWDRELAVGQSYDEAIQRQLERSRCVVVLWSRHSVESHWVKAEAQDAAERKRLFPALLDPVKPPLEYRYLNGVDLTGWSGSPDDPELLVNLGLVLVANEQWKDAEQVFRAALERDKSYARAHLHLGSLRRGTDARAY